MNPARGTTKSRIPLLEINRDPRSVQSAFLHILPHEVAPRHLFMPLGSMEPNSETSGSVEMAQMLRQKYEAKR